MTEEEKKKKEQANMTSPKTFDIRQDEVSETPRPVVDAVSAVPINAGVPTAPVPQMQDSRLDTVYVPPRDVFVGGNTWIDQNDHSVHRVNEAAIKAAPVANRPQTLDEALNMAHNNMNAALDESMAAEDKANAEQLQADAARASLYPAGVYDSIFGPEKTEPEKTELEKLDEARRLSYKEMIENRKKVLQQQQTNDYRLASFNALGNALRTMVQPVGWAAGSSTAGVQPYDERQYLESFNRAVKANDDLRNLGVLEDQFKYKLADEEYQRKVALEDSMAAKDFDAKVKAEYAKERHQYTMEEIAARGDVQKQVAMIRAKNVKKNGKNISEDDLKTAKTQWYRYLGRYWDDVGRNVERKEKNGPLSFSQFLTNKYGYTVDYSDGEDLGLAVSDSEDLGLE